MRSSELKKTLHEVNAAEWEELKGRLQSPQFLEAVIKFAANKKSRNKLW